jgi:hypothetical protein
MSDIEDEGLPRVAKHGLTASVVDEWQRPRERARVVVMGRSFVVARAFKLVRLTP